MIYLITSGKYIKIGYTSNKKDRFSQYSTCNPDFRILDTYEEGTTKDESNLHKILQHYTYRGEWMYYNDEIIKEWNNYTGHNIQTLPVIEKSEYEQEISKLSKRLLEIELDKDCARYSKYLMINNLALLRNAPTKLLDSVNELIDDYTQNDLDKFEHRMNKIFKSIDLKDELINVLIEKINLLDPSHKIEYNF